MTRAYDVLTSMANVEVTIASRELMVIADRSSGDPRSASLTRVLNASYQRIQATYRHPDDWRLATQREREMEQTIVPGKKLVFGKVGAGDGALLLRNLVTDDLTRMVIPAALFRQEILERAGGGLRSDLVLGTMLFNRADTGAAAFKLPEVVRAGTEDVKGVRFARLVARSSIEQTTLWIDEGTGLIMRVLVAPVRDRFGGSLHVQETLYSYDQLKGADNADFDLDAGWKEMRETFSASAGFVPARELAAWVVSSQSIPAPQPIVSAKPPPAPSQPPTPPSGSTQGATQASPPASSSSAATPAQAPVVEEQLLTPLQMESIVLVEGEEGVGSGFVARIRDVDFVVTNQHVIGGNDKIRVTTVRGVPIKVGAVFGAVGRDIAILRIEGENKVPALKIAEDPVKTIKLGDKVAVVGNRRGGGVATQVSGVVRGIGPDKIEVDAPFQPGNSGSPILHVASSEVIGLATYSLTRRLDMLDGSADRSTSKSAAEPATEQRWFGHRADGIAKWEAIDMAKWRAQAKRIEDFQLDSEAIYQAMNGRFKEASRNPRVRQLIDRFEARAERLGGTQALLAQEVQEFFRGLRALAETGTKDLKTGEYYDYFRTNLYWETSITQQLRAREELSRGLDRAAESSAAFLAKLRR